MKNKKLLFTIFTISAGIFLTGFIFTRDSQVHAKTVVIHLTTNIKNDDVPPCVAFDMALTNLKLGNKVEFLFDGEAAWNLKKSNDGKNDFDRYTIPADLKKLLLAEFNDKSLMKLKTFGDFLKFLNDKGVKITVNGTWNVLTSVEKGIKGKTNIPSYVQPLTLKEMAEHINNTQVYYKY